MPPFSNTRYPPPSSPHSRSSPTYSPPPCPYTGCTLPPGSYHTHYYPSHYDPLDPTPAPCPWPHCPQLKIHAHRYNPSGLGHDVRPLVGAEFDMKMYLDGNPELKAKLEAGMVEKRREMRGRLGGKVVRKGEKRFFFRDPSWCGDVGVDEEQDEIEVEVVKVGKEEGEEVKEDKFPRPYPKSGLLERRHTLAGMEVVDDI